MPKDKNLYKQTVNNLPLICAAAGGAIGALDGFSLTNPIPITNIAIGAGAGLAIGYQTKKTLQNNDKNKTKIGISSTCAITGMALNAAFNSHATMMNTIQAGAGGMLIGKGGKFIVAKGTTYIQNTPQYQVLKHGHNIQKKLKKTKDFGSIIKQANALDSQKKYVKRQTKSNAL